MIDFAQIAPLLIGILQGLVITAIALVVLAALASSR